MVAGEGAAIPWSVPAPSNQVCSLRVPMNTSACRKQDGKASLWLGTPGTSEQLRGSGPNKAGVPASFFLLTPHLESNSVVARP